MDFSSLIFWQTLLPALAIIYLISSLLKVPQKIYFHKIAIAALGLSLLGLASIETLLIFLSVTMTAWVACKFCVQCKLSTKRIVLVPLIIVILLPLLYYKYSDFICNDIAGREWNTLRDLIIPIGISFYTFQIIGFCIDTLIKNKEMPKFIDYLNFAAFFPQIVAGPIERRADLLPQVQKMQLPLRATNYETGIPFVILGLFFKLTLADNLATAFHNNYTGSNAWMIWLNNILFTFRIYFDFAGYGLCAYGIAKCLGITLRMNFLSPYTATNITEFWRRWHTSLTLWFRDYIYFPLGGSRTKRWALNIIIVFTISGIWHGAGWNFIIWGTFAGVAMVVHRIFRNKGYKLPSIIGWGITFVMMVFVWMFFYDSNQELLCHHLNVISDAENYGIRVFFNELIENQRAASLAFVFILMAFTVIFIEFISQRKTPDEPYRLLLSPYACGIMIFLMIIFYNSTQNAFIYFAF